MLEFSLYRSGSDRIELAINPLTLPLLDVTVSPDPGLFSWQYYGGFQLFEADDTPGPVVTILAYADVFRDAYSCAFRLPGGIEIPSQYTKVKAVNGLRLTDMSYVPFYETIGTATDSRPLVMPSFTSITPGDSKLTVAVTVPPDPGNPGLTVIALAAQCPTVVPLQTIKYSAFGATVELTGLTNGVTYNFGISARSVAGNGYWSYGTGTPATVPDAPTITSVTPGPKSLGVTFTPPADNGGYAITSYRYSIDGGSTYTVIGTSTSFTISGLNSGTTYSVILRAVNSVGPGDWSASVSGTTIAAPSAPTITGISGGYTQLVVSFTPPTSTGGLPILAYHYSLDSGVTYSVAPSTTSPFFITGLEYSTSYPVILRAVTQAGVSAWSLPVIGETATIGVFAVAERVVRVSFNPSQWAYPPLHAASTGLNDALNPRTWRILSLGSVPSENVELTCLSVAALDAWTYDILTLEQFPRAGNSLNNVAGSFLNMRLETNPELAFESGPNISFAVDFSGSLASDNATTNAKTVALGLAIRDVANASITPLSSLLGGDYSEFVSGTLVINAAGDYESSSGEALLRKLIMRRLITQPGDFFHLPNYGAGIAVKATFSTANLRSLAKEIEMQVLREPEIEKAKATLTYQAATSSLIVQVQARMRSTGQQTALSISLPLGGTTQF